MNATEAELLLREGKPEAALFVLQNQIRGNPADARLRIFLFQLLSVLGDWERALNQLNLAAELDASALAMAQMYREAIACELLRVEVFAGRKAPMVFGPPERWLALQIEALLVGARGDPVAAEDLRAQAFDEAPVRAGAIDDQPFAWLADSDMRLGPVCEAIINGRYYWLPFSKLNGIRIEAPADLRDHVWMPAHFLFINGGETVGVIPTRYPGSEASSDGAIRLARKTEWTETSSGMFVGLGQRQLTTESGGFALMDVRSIQFAGEDAAESEQDGSSAA